MVRKERGAQRRGGVTREVPASELKNSWHEYLDRVNQSHEEVVVTRYGKPVARLVPFVNEDDAPGIFGFLAGTVKVTGDIVGSTGAEWEADA